LQSSEKSSVEKPNIQQKHLKQTFGFSLKA